MWKIKDYNKVTIHLRSTFLLLTDLAMLPTQRIVTKALGKRGDMRSINIPA
jgi:hypothetical protein